MRETFFEHVSDAVSYERSRELRLLDAAGQGDAREVLELLAAGVDVNARDAHGMTALHHAAFTASRAVIRVLINDGRCDYLAQDNEGRYASELAIQPAKDFAVARLLIKRQLWQAHGTGVTAWVPCLSTKTLC